VNFFGKASPWYAFEVLRADVFQIWPLHWRSTTAGELRALDWLKRDLIKRGIKIVSKATRREYAVKQFHISGRAFDEHVWRRALVETGVSEASRAGRKSGR
jgi:hypothetical protein